MKKYQVIGGQYESCWIGESDSLHGAKIHLPYPSVGATEHKPCIYRAEDVEIVESYGRICTPDGWDIRVTKPGARPWVWRGDRWVRREEWE